MKIKNETRLLPELSHFAKCTFSLKSIKTFKASFSKIQIGKKQCRATKLDEIEDLPKWRRYIFSFGFEMLKNLIVLMFTPIFLMSVQKKTYLIILITY